MSIRVITKETFNAENMGTQVGTVGMPDKYYDCCRFVDKRKLRSVIGPLPKGAKILHILTIQMDDEEYENVVNHNVCYTEPLCATRNQAGAYLIQSKYGYEYWGVDNPTGNVIVVVNLLAEPPVEPNPLMDELETLESMNPFTSGKPMEACICRDDWNAMCEERVVDLVKEIAKKTPSIMNKYGMRVKAFDNQSRKWYVSEGSMSKFTYERSFKHLIKNKEAKEAYDEVFKDDEDAYIEYYRVRFNNPKDAKWEFSSIWFLEYCSGFIPVVVKGVNTSSALAMEMCGMDREEEGEFDYERSLSTILGWMTHEQDKKSVLTLLLQ